MKSNVRIPIQSSTSKKLTKSAASIRVELMIKRDIPRMPHREVNPLAFPRDVVTELRDAVFGSNGPGSVSGFGELSLIGNSNMIGGWLSESVHLANAISNKTQMNTLITRLSIRQRQMMAICYRWILNTQQL